VNNGRTDALFMSTHSHITSSFERVPVKASQQVAKVHYTTLHYSVCVTFLYFIYSAQSTGCTLSTNKTFHMEHYLIRFIVSHRTKLQRCYAFAAKCIEMNS